MVSTVFTVSFIVVLFVVVWVVLSLLSFVVLSFELGGEEDSFVVLSFVELSFVVLSFELGGEDSVVVLLEVEVSSVVDCFVVVVGVEGCVVVAFDVDFCVVVMDFELVSFALVIDGSVVLKCVAFRIEFGVVTVPFVVELLIEAVEFCDVLEDVVLGFTSETFCGDVPSAGEVSV